MALAWCRLGPISIRSSVSAVAGMRRYVQSSLLKRVANHVTLIGALHDQDNGSYFRPWRLRDNKGKFL